MWQGEGGSEAAAHVAIFADVGDILAGVAGEVHVMGGPQGNEGLLGSALQQPLHTDHVHLVLARL